MKTVGALLGLALGGIMLADIVTHPDGVTAAANGIVNILKPTYSAMLGVAPR